MFNPSLTDVRNFFFDTYKKLDQQAELTPLEKIAAGIIIEHPEYKAVLSNPDKFLSYTWLPEAGETNPFLHLSMHMSIAEQLSIDQPLGVTELYQQLCTKAADIHEAEHQMMDCLAEMIWQAQYSNNEPNPQIYLNCLNKKLGKLDNQ